MEGCDEENFQKLLKIQNSLLTGKLLGAGNSTLSDLACRGRVFIGEIDLQKVCRKENKTFHFWLFNDCVIYGNQLETGNYLFHRMMDLINCSVSVHKSLIYKCALEISSAEKSFVVMASSEPEQMRWMNLMIDAISAIREIQATECDGSFFDTPFSNQSATMDASSSPFFRVNEALAKYHRGSVTTQKIDGAKACSICNEVKNASEIIFCTKTSNALLIISAV